MSQIPNLTQLSAQVLDEQGRDLQGLAGEGKVPEDVLKYAPKRFSSVTIDITAGVNGTRVELDDDVKLEARIEVTYNRGEYNIEYRHTMRGWGRHVLLNTSTKDMQTAIDLTMLIINNHGGSLSVDVCGPKDEEGSCAIPLSFYSHVATDGAEKMITRLFRVITLSHVIEYNYNVVGKWVS